MSLPEHLPPGAHSLTGGPNGQPKPTTSHPLAPVPAAPEQPQSVHPVVTALALLFAMSFPTLAAWGYFLALAQQGGQVNRAQQMAYVEGKFVQFAFPLVFVLLVERRLPRLSWPRWRGLGMGVAFGLLVAAVMLGVYFGWLRRSSLLVQTPARIHQKLRETGLDSPGGYIGLGAFVALAHSLFEEYYWRWFVFGRLRLLMSLWPAIVLSSLGFMAHHVVVLYVYLPGKFLSAVVPFSLAIAVGGAVWAWLYERSGSIYPSWISHLIVDTAIFVVGWDLLARSGW
jgi:membrane protease YdiL (CAAX protease family)